MSIRICLFSPYEDAGGKILGKYAELGKKYEESKRWKFLQGANLPDLLDEILKIPEEERTTHSPETVQERLDLLHVNSYRSIFTLLLKRTHTVRIELKLKTETDLLFLRDLFFTMLVISGFSVQMCRYILKNITHMFVKLDDKECSVADYIFQEKVREKERGNESVSLEELFKKHMDDIKLEFSRAGSSVTESEKKFKSMSKTCPKEFPNASTHVNKIIDMFNELTVDNGKIRGHVDERLFGIFKNLNVDFESYAISKVVQKLKDNLLRGVNLVMHHGEEFTTKDVIELCFRPVIRGRFEFKNEENCRVLALSFEICYRIQELAEKMFEYVREFVSSTNEEKKKILIEAEKRVSEDKIEKQPCVSSTKEEEKKKLIEIEKRVNEDKIEKQPNVEKSQRVGPQEPNLVPPKEKNVDNLSWGFLNYCLSVVNNHCENRNFEFDGVLTSNVSQFFSNGLRDHYGRISETLDKELQEVFEQIDVKFNPCFLIECTENDGDRFVGNVTFVGERGEKFRFVTVDHNIDTSNPNKCRYVIVRHPNKSRNKRLITDIQVNGVENVMGKCEIYDVVNTHSAKTNEKVGADFTIIEAELYSKMVPEMSKETNEELVFDETNDEGRYFVPCVFGTVTKERARGWMFLSPHLFILLYACFSPKHVYEGSDDVHKALVTHIAKLMVGDEGLFKETYVKFQYEILRERGIFPVMFQLEMFKYFDKIIYPVINHMLVASIFECVVLISDPVFLPKFEKDLSEKKKVILKMFTVEEDNDIKNILENVTQFFEKTSKENLYEKYGLIDLFISCVGGLSGSLVKDMKGRVKGLVKARSEAWYANASVPLYNRFVKGKCEEQGIETKHFQMTLREQQKLPKKCFFCKKVNDLKRCSRCKLVWYCFVECQRKDWKEHQKVCQKKIDTE